MRRHTLEQLVVDMRVELEAVLLRRAAKDSREFAFDHVVLVDLFGRAQSIRVVRPHQHLHPSAPGDLVVLVMTQHGDRTSGFAPTLTHYTVILARRSEKTLLKVAF